MYRMISDHWYWCVDVSSDFTKVPKVKACKCFSGDFSFDVSGEQENQGNSCWNSTVQQLWLCLCIFAYLCARLRNDSGQVHVCSFELEIETEGWRRCVCVFERWCDRTYRVWNGAGRFRLQLQLTATHTHTHLNLFFSPILPLSLPLISFCPAFPSSRFHPFPTRLLLLSFLLFHFLCISPSPLYSAALSLWIKLSLLWSLFFPLLCLYLPFGYRVCAAAWSEGERRWRREERERQRPHVRPIMD